MNFAILSAVILFLSYVCGRLFGAHDAGQPDVKHDGRRFGYRAALIGAVCGAAVWQCDWPWWAATMSWVGGGFLLSTGVRLGFNTTRNLNRCYISAGNLYDRLFIAAVTGRTHRALKASHQDWYNANDFGYCNDVHQAGRNLTVFECCTALLLFIITISIDLS